MYKDMEARKITTQTLPTTSTEELQVASQPMIEPSDGSKQKQAIPALDGVRGLACLAVISFHLNLWSYYGQVWSALPGDMGAVVTSLALVGESGVLLFFILSGVLLFLPYARAMLFESPWPSTQQYYLRRFFRVLPGYYVALFLMLLFIAPEYLQPDHREALWLFLTMRMDFPLTYQQINPPFWTLAIEFQFYLLLPLIAAIIGRIVTRGTVKQRLGKLVLCLLVIFTWGVLTRYWGLRVANTSQLDFLLPHKTWDAIHPYIYGNEGKFFEAFATGMLIATAYTYLQNASAKEKLNRRVRNLSPAILALGLLVITAVAIWHFHAFFVPIHFLDRYNDLIMPNLNMYIYIGYTVGYGLCLFAVMHGSDRLKRPLERSWLRWVGLASYSLYVWHDAFILYFFGSFLPRFKSLGWSHLALYATFVLWIIVTAVPIATIVYRRVEVPGIRAGEKLYKLVKTYGASSLLLGRKPKPEITTPYSQPTRNT
jgi:peptidoglycan/LPS O-acetylase OafA/YrhL